MIFGMWNPEKICYHRVIGKIKRWPHFGTQWISPQLHQIFPLNLQISQRRIPATYAANFITILGLIQKWQLLIFVESQQLFQQNLQDVAWILTYAVWKFGSISYYHCGNTSFFLGDCFFGTPCMWRHYDVGTLRHFRDLSTARSHSL